MRKLSIGLSDSFTRIDTFSGLDIFPETDGGSKHSLPFFFLR